MKIGKAKAFPIFLFLFQIIHSQDHNTEQGQDDARDAVEGLWGQFVCPKGGDSCPDEGENHAQDQHGKVGCTAKGEMADRAGQRREGHDENTCSYSGFQFVAEYGGQNNQHHHAPACTDKSADEADEDAADDTFRDLAAFGFVHSCPAFCLGLYKRKKEPKKR